MADDTILSPDMIRRELAVLARNAIGSRELMDVYRGILVDLPTPATIIVNGKYYILPLYALNWSLDHFSEVVLQPIVWEFVVGTTAPEILNYWTA